MDLRNRLRVLMIGAHPDDCEFRAGATAVKYSSLGHTVKFVSCTNGELGHFAMSGKALAEIRKNEHQCSARVAGIEGEVLDIADGSLTASLANRNTIVGLIRDFVPDMVFTHRPNDYHPDHRAASILVQDAIYLAKVPAYHPSVAALQKSPSVFYMQDAFTKPAPFSPDVIVDIDDVMDTKVKMCDCHKSQVYEWLPSERGELDQVPEDAADRIEWLARYVVNRDSTVADRFRSEILSRLGTTIGNEIHCVEAFEISEYGAGVSEENLAGYFPFLGADRVSRHEDQ